MITPDQMRHWRNDQLRKRGCPIEVRRAIVGHESEKMNMSYTEVGGLEGRKWVEDGGNLLMELHTLSTGRFDVVLERVLVSYGNRPDMPADNSSDAATATV